MRAISPVGSINLGNHDTKSGGSGEENHFIKHPNNHGNYANRSWGEGRAVKSFAGAFFAGHGSKRAAFQFRFGLADVLQRAGLEPAAACKWTPTSNERICRRSTPTRWRWPWTFATPWNFSTAKIRATTVAARNANAGAWSIFPPPHTRHAPPRPQRPRRRHREESESPSGLEYL